MFLSLLVRNVRDLIFRVWHEDPLRCPVCQNPIRVAAVIDNPQIVAASPAAEPSRAVRPPP